MSLAAIDMAGTHLLDLVSLSNPEIASFGNTSNGAYIKWYHDDAPSSSYHVGFRNNTFNVCSETSANTTRVGIATTAANASANLHVHGTLMTSNISTYNPDNTVYFNNQSVGGISNIWFSGNIYQGGSPFKTSQWETVSTSSIYFPGNVGIGGTAGTNSNMFVVGDVVVTGKVLAQEFQEKANVSSQFSTYSLYAADNDGYRQIETNATSYSDRVLFSCSLKTGRYFLTTTVPYKNMSTFLTFDSFNWAFIGLYKSTPGSLSESTQPICTVQLKSIGSTNTTDVDDVNIAWFVEVPEDAQYVIAVNGKGHLLRFGPYNTSSPVTLFSIPIKSLGQNDRVDVRQSLQAKPIRSTIRYNTTLNNTYHLSTDGFYYVHASNVDIYVNGSKKLYWLNELNREFNVTSTFVSNSGNQTIVSISLATSVANTLSANDIIDTTVWLTTTADTFFESGYLYQNFNITSVPWHVLEGGGVRLPETRCVIDGDLYVSGNIYGGCNTNSFTSGGIIVDYFDSFERSSNVVGTVNVADGAITTSKLNLTNGNVGIGTLSAPEKLMVVGNIVPGASGMYDLGTQSLTWRDVRIGRQFVSTLPNGTPPLVVASSNQVLNLNASYLQGYDSNYYRNANNMNAGTLSVSRGGTGASSFTQHKLVVAGASSLSSSALHWSNERLGVNTATPLFTLDVLGSARIQTPTNSTLSITTGGLGGVAMSASNNLKLLINPYESFSNVIVMGQVGIGTTIPSNALTVQGEIRSTSNMLSDLQFLGTNVGSVTSPTFAWSQYRSTGLYSPTPNAIGVVTAGQDRLRVLSNGNIGFGTNNPETQFVVSMPSASSNVVKYNGLDTNAQLVMMMGFNDGKEFFIEKNKTQWSDIDGTSYGQNDIAVIKNRSASLYLQNKNFGVDQNGQLIYEHRHILSVYLLVNGGTMVTLPTSFGTNNVVFNSSIDGLTTSYNMTTGVFTVPISGRYYISAKVCINLDGGVSTNQTTATLALKKNTTQVNGFGSSIKKTGNNTPSEVCLYGDAVLKLLANDQLSIDVYGDNSPRLVTAEPRSSFSIIYLG